MSEQTSPRALLAASRLRRQLDKAKIPCPPLSAMAAPKGGEVAALRELLNHCMGAGGEIADLAEDLWDELRFGPHGGPAPDEQAEEELERAKARLAELALLEEKARKEKARKEKAEAEQAKASGKKKGLFGWLGGEGPPKDDDEDDDGDGRYRGGLR